MWEPVQHSGVKYLDKDIYEFFKDKEDKIKLPIFRIIKWSKTTGFVDYKDYKKAMASARSKAIAEKNEAVKAKELMKKELMQIKKLREKPTALTKLQAKKLAELEEKYKEYII